MDRKAVLRVLGPLAAIAAGGAVWWAGVPAAAAWTVGVTVLCAVWWVTEAIPIPATSLVPMALLPLVGVVTAEQVAGAYGNKLILLLLGGFMLSTAMERSGAHRRLALAMVGLCAWGAPRDASGMPRVTGRRLVCGFMLASAGLSMWVSNSATTLMLLPIALAVLDAGGSSSAGGPSIGGAAGGIDESGKRLRLALLLGIAYAASIGGIGTPIGTPPNLLCLEAFSTLPGGQPTFLTWMGWALPVVGLMLPATALWLTRGLGSDACLTPPAAGAWTPAEARTLAVFGVTALLWVTRKEPFGGWSALPGLGGASDASVALLAVVAMFLIPSGERPDPSDEAPTSEGGAPSDRLLDWETASRIPWGMLLLFSGGMVLARAFGESGLSVLLGDALADLGGLGPALLVAGLCLGVTFLTEVTSNTATTALLMPVLASLSVAAEIDPRLLLVPTALSASFAFMLPVATVPNAVVYGAGVEVRDMAREGLVLNLIGAAVIATVCCWRFG